jgi:hypothetical protein
MQARTRAASSTRSSSATSPEAFTHEVHSEGGVIRDVESQADDAPDARHPVRGARVPLDRGARLAAARAPGAARRPIPPCARIVYRDKARYDLTRCVTASVTGGMIAAPRCTYEVEVEAVGEITAESLGPRPSGYAVHCA